MEQNYLNIIKTVLDEGELIPNRTGTPAYTYPHLMIKFDLKDGFPLLTTKKMAWNSIKVELEFFIKGLTDKNWLKERKCSIWNEWCNPAKIPSKLKGEERKQFQLNESDLGKIYGYQWRNFNSDDIDQVKWILSELKSNPDSRKLVCSAWNPCQKDEQALEPCHVLWHVFKQGNRLNLCWFMRSVDLGAGLPFNIASYALLLHLLCKETGYEEGVLTGFLSNAHIYENHVEPLREQLKREPFKFPRIQTNNFNGLFNWEYKDTELLNYESHPKISLEIAV